tara:strand:- start:52 stop:3528 length:3477 start_codon:yes stop_codon:yes gene_type:complete
MRTEEDQSMFKALPFYFQNIRSKNGTDKQGRQRINRRYDMLKETITANNIELAWFAEGRLKNTEKLYPPPGYEIIRTNGPSGSFGLRQKNTDITHITIDNNKYDISFFTHRIEKYAIIMVYLQPYDVCHLEERLDFIMDTIKKQKWKHYIIVGDTNAKHPTFDVRHQEDRRGKLLHQWLADNDIMMLNPGEVTYFRKGHTSTIDHVLCSSNMVQEIEYQMTTTTTSDHFGIHFGKPAPNQIETKSMIYDIDKFNVDLFDEHLDSITVPLRQRMLRVASEADSKNLEQWFWNSVQQAYRISTPKKEQRWSPIKPHENQPAYKKIKLQQVKLFRSLRHERKYSKRKKLEDKIKEINFELESITETLRYEAWQKFLARFEKYNNGNHTRLLYKLFQKSRGKAKYRTLDGETSETKKCHVCVRRWKDVYKPHPTDTKNRTFHQETEEWRHTFRNTENKHGTLPYNRKFTPEDIQRILHTMSPYKSPGDDGIHLNMLKKSNKLHQLWALVFNVSFQWGTRHKSRKAAVFCLIPKPGKELNTPLNGRTISLLQIASKVEDKLVELRLREAIPPEKLSKYQYAFMKNRSCETALTRMTQRIEDGIFNKKLVGIMLFTDASKAYPKAWHSGMVRKLSEKYGVRGSLLLWIDDWLRERTARFKFGRTLSQHMQLQSGVPEGSSLSCYLFITYYDIYEHIKFADYQIYCDDVTPYKLFAPSRWGEMQTRLQKDLTNMTTWCMKWRMRFNGDKSGYLIMDRRKDAKKKQASWNMTLNLQGKIKRRECGKCLGLWFDERLTFEKHALVTHMKLQKKRRFLLRLCSTRSHMPFNVRLKFYNTWFTATSRYVAPIWRSKKNLKVKQLDSLESQTLKRVLGLPGSVSNDTPHVLAMTLPPRHRTQVQCTKTWLRTNVWVEDAAGNGHVVEEEVLNWSSFGYHIESLLENKWHKVTTSWNRVSLYRRLSLITTKLLGAVHPTTRATKETLKKKLKAHNKTIMQNAELNFKTDWKNERTKAMHLKKLDFMPGSRTTGITLKLPSIATSWMRAICGVGNLGTFMLSRGQRTKLEATCDVCNTLQDMDHILQCRKYVPQRLRINKQLTAIMDRNDETTRLTTAEKTSREAARKARHARPKQDAFSCMRHVTKETNRYNLSAVAAALHSYIRMTIETI